MKLDVIKLDGGNAGSVDLDEALFGLEPRADILHRVVRWQRNNAQQGTHKVKTRSPRSHGHELTKKFRKLGLRHALSAKAKAGSLVIIDEATSEGKTAALAKQVSNLGWKRTLVIDGASVNENFAQAARNIEGLDILPSMGANVYDILKRDTLVITKAGIEALEARLK